MTSGKDKGKQGKIISVLVKEQRVIVENINLRKKHQRSKTGGKKGEIIEVPRSISISTVALVCKNCGKPTRIGCQILPGDSKMRKIRICKKCGSEA